MNPKSIDKSTAEVVVDLCSNLNITPAQLRGLVVKSSVLEAMADLVYAGHGRMTVDTINKSIFNKFNKMLDLDEIKEGVALFIDELVNEDKLATKTADGYYPTAAGLLIGRQKQKVTRMDKEAAAVRNN